MNIASYETSNRGYKVSLERALETHFSYNEYSEVRSVVHDNIT
jgi:hypothetical protein